MDTKKPLKKGKADGTAEGAAKPAEGTVKKTVDLSAATAGMSWDSVFAKPEPPKEKALDPATKPFNPTGFAPPQAPQYEDDAIVSMSTGQRPTFTNKAKQDRTHQDFLDNPDGKKGVSKPTRELEKTRWIAGSNVQGTQIGVGLADLDQNETYDQFKDKKSTYHDDLYNIAINEAELTYEQRAHAERIERDIMSH